MSAFYEAVFGLKRTHMDSSFAVLESPVAEWVVVSVPKDVASGIELATPPALRTGTPIKLVFPVRSIAACRAAAERLGGGFNPPDKQWEFNGAVVCDGFDPEGNVVQAREPA